MKIKKIHSWKTSAKEAIRIQNRLSKKIKRSKVSGPVKVIGGCDASFSKDEDKVLAAVVILSFPALEVLEVVTAIRKANFPYVPGLLTFREGPALLDCFKKIKIKPRVLFFDGQGIAHPRHMGIATHMGILLDLPTIGCAKSKLFGTYKEPAPKRGSFSIIKGKDNEILGAALRTKDDVRPVFVSLGHKMNLEDAIKLTLKVARKYRIPEPLRQAHQSANRI
ncbi:MAG: endonuclease V [Omnitrophica WOR_2 bacterium SM23_29]|nr:MAG: endonuclease V [Omnitrophica WOR_2 bacterium SM23_29]